MAQVRIYLFIYCERNVYQQIAIIVSCSWQRAAEREGGVERDIAALVALTGANVA